MDRETLRGDLEPDTSNVPVHTVQKLSVQFYFPPRRLSRDFVLLTVGTVRSVSAAQGTAWPLNCTVPLLHLTFYRLLIIFRFDVTA